MARHWLLPFLTTCSSDSKPCMIVKALVKDYKHHKGFAIISASGAEWVQPTSSHEQGNPLLSGPVRVNYQAARHTRCCSKRFSLDDGINEASTDSRCLEALRYSVSWGFSWVAVPRVGRNPERRLY